MVPGSGRAAAVPEHLAAVEAQQQDCTIPPNVVDIQPFQGLCRAGVSPQPGKQLSVSLCMQHMCGGTLAGTPMFNMLPTINVLHNLGMAVCTAVKRWFRASQVIATVMSHLQPDVQMKHDLKHVQGCQVDSQASPLSPLSQPRSSSLPDFLQARETHLNTTKGLEICPCRSMEHADSIVKHSQAVSAAMTGSGACERTIPVSQRHMWHRLPAPTASAMAHAVLHQGLVCSWHRQLRGGICWHWGLPGGGRLALAGRCSLRQDGFCSPNALCHELLVLLLLPAAEV